LEYRASGGATGYTYDDRGRLLTIARGPSATDLRERIEYTYHILDGKKSMERAVAWDSGVWVEKRRESFAYDAEGRLQTVTHADGTMVRYTYDEDGIATIQDERHTTRTRCMHTIRPDGSRR
jgi:YD repeat-containing protein